MEFLIFASAILLVKSLRNNESALFNVPHYLNIPLGTVMFFMFIRFFIGGFPTLLHSIVSIIIAFIFLADIIKMLAAGRKDTIERADRIIKGFSLPIAAIGIILGFIGLFIKY